ncbi:MAG: PD-(D/E)XK nuclease family protein [Candidatus Thiodiazotropha endolucinida]
MSGKIGGRCILKLQLISNISPSLAEILRNCPLQAALTRVSGIRDFVLGNPKAWLGTAYHEVLEKLWLPAHSTLGDEELVEHLWGNVIDSLQKQAHAHPLNRRFAEAEKWPGYYLVRACVQVRAQQELAEHPRQVVLTVPSDNLPSTLRKLNLAAMGGKIIGKPDVIIGDEIHDYKSGSVYEDTPEGKQIIKQGYIRQLRLYGYLVYEAQGYWPAKGKLHPMLGESVEIDLDPGQCTAEANEAVDLLNSFNTRMVCTSDVSELATPSPEACHWCQYKALCHAFWSGVNNEWTDVLGNAAVCGILEQDPVPIHNGRALSLSIGVTAGTTDASHITIAPLDRTAHDLSNFQSGDAVRLVNLYQRHDCQLVPTKATLCFLDSRCPSFTVPTTSS